MCGYTESAKRDEWMWGEISRSHSNYTPGGDTLFYLVGALSSHFLSLLLSFHVRVFAPGYAEKEGLVFN